MSRLKEQVKNTTVSNLLLNVRDGRLGREGCGEDKKPRWVDVGHKHLKDDLPSHRAKRHKTMRSDTLNVMAFQEHFGVL